MSPSLENKARVGQLTSIDRKRQLAYFLLTQHKKIQVETKEMSLFPIESVNICFDGMSRFFSSGKSLICRIMQILGRPFEKN